jgi:hypothetical protein
MAPVTDACTRVVGIGTTSACTAGMSGEVFTRRNELASISYSNRRSAPSRDCSSAKGCNDRSRRGSNTVFTASMTLRTTSACKPCSSSISSSVLFRGTTPREIFESGARWTSGLLTRAAGGGAAVSHAPSETTSTNPIENRPISPVRGGGTLGAHGIRRVKGVKNQELSKGTRRMRPHYQSARHKAAGSRFEVPGCRPRRRSPWAGDG